MNLCRFDIEHGAELDSMLGIRVVLSITIGMVLFIKIVIKIVN